MKKFCKLFICTCLIFTLLLFSFACQKSAGLEQYVSELRSDVYYGACDTLAIKGGYGYKETPYHGDGSVGTRAYFLTLKLLDQETTQASFSVKLEFKDKEYNSEFKFNPVTHSLVANIEITGFDLKEFNVNIINGADTHVVTLKSLVPENTINYITALNSLEKTQPELIKAYTDENGNFTAEIYARIIVKDGKAYWYVGLLDKSQTLKALLIDGATGEVLAIREIF